MPELIADLLPRLVKERELSWADLSERTALAGRYVQPKTIEAIRRRAGSVPEADILEALAAALEVSPDTFYEWPISLVRSTRKKLPPALRPEDPGSD